MTNQTIPHTESRIFEGFRSLGHVSNEIPCLTRYIHRRRENFIVSCIGKSFNTYASQKLKLLSVSGTHSSDITCMAADSYHVYTAAAGKVYAWRRGVELKHTYDKKEGDDVISMLPFATNLITLDRSGNLVVWDIVTEEIVLELHLKNQPQILMHPATYIDKIIIGFQNGSMQLWNIKTAKLIYTFKSFNSSINAIVQSPTVDVVAISLPDMESIAIHNLKYDETVFFLKCEESITSLAFRTDNVPVLIAGSKNGTLSMWDLEKKEIMNHVKGAHQCSIASVQCFPQEPLFVTSSADNSLKVWIFDMPDGGFRLYNSREGHILPSSRIRFHGTKGFYILSAGQDSKFLMFHIYNETYNRSLGKTNVSSYKMKMKRNFALDDDFKMPRIVDFTSECVANPNHHDDIAACHMGQTGVSTWSFNNTKRGDKLLILSKYKKLHKVDVSATCLCLTSCGQFVIAGYDDGTVERFNIQSGHHRKTYGSPAHRGSIRGVAVDTVNSVVVSGSSDRLLNFWNFATGEKTSKLKFAAGISFIFSHRNSGLLGAALDDFTIVIVNAMVPNVVRRFDEIFHPILDASFSPDCRFVTASTSDCLVRTWDLPTSNLVDVFRLESIVTSVDYSPNGEFLATTLNNNISILLWMNKTLFSHVSLMPIQADYEPPLLSLPETRSDEHDDEDKDWNYTYQSPDQIDENLITLSLLPESRWKNLLNLDTIKMRNRPKQPPKNYEAPFFLTSLMGSADGEPNATVISDKNDDNSQTLDTQPASTSKFISVNVSHSKFGAKLLNPNKSPDHYTELCEMLGELGPSQVDVEIRSLGPSGGGSVEMLKAFVIFLNEIFHTNRYFETSQAYLALFLKVHSETILEDAALKLLLEEVSETIEKRDEHLMEQTNAVLAFSSFLKSTLF